MGQSDQTANSTIRHRLCQALSQAESQAPNDVRAQTLRLIKCALDDRDVTARQRGECSGCEEPELQRLLETMVAQREVSAGEYDDAGRIADAERERDEINVIEEFLPKPLSGKALEMAVQAIVTELEATRLKDVGRCMSALRERFPGQIECGSAGKAVREALA
ncbi:MAG: GatB/YqeY domain-containing protein [Alphaproteobacteria bacterium]|nr:GatB/YqeY domain-containing protein [Alphaproteobacteria bacterium]